jgi:hypothetical protein
MDARDVIAIPATLAFIGGGFYWIVAQRLRAWRAYARAQPGPAKPSKWQQLSHKQRMLRRIGGVALGIGVALVLQVIGHEIIDSVYP